MMPSFPIEWTISHNTDKWHCWLITAKLTLPGNKVWYWPSWGGVVGYATENPELHFPKMKAEIDGIICDPMTGAAFLLALQSKPENPLSSGLLKKLDE